MSTTVRRGSSSPSLSSAVVIVLIGGTSCVTVEAGKQKPLSVQGCDATFGVLVTRFRTPRYTTCPAWQRVDTNNAWRASAKSSFPDCDIDLCHSARPQIRRSGFGSVPSIPPCLVRSRSGSGEADVVVRDIGGEECQEACAFI